MARSRLILGAILFSQTIGLSAGNADSAAWQREACSAAGVLTMKFPKGGPGTRGACIATGINRQGDFVVPRHCIEGALSAHYTPLRSPRAPRSKKYRVLGVYRIEPTTHGTADVLNADVVRIRVDIPAHETSAIDVAAEFSDQQASEKLQMIVNLAARRGKAGECTVRNVELVSSLDTPGHAGRTVRIGSRTREGGSGTPVFVSGELLGIVVGSDPEQTNDVVTVLAGHPVFRGGGELVGFAEWNEAHKDDAWSLFYGAADYCEKEANLLARALELDPSIADGWFRRAGCAASSGDVSHAVEYLERALDHRPLPETYYFLGRICLAGDLDVEKGRAALQTALKLDPDYYAARLFLAGSYAEKGELGKAAVHFGYILERWPGVRERIWNALEKEHPELAAELRASRGQ